MSRRQQRRKRKRRASIRALRAEHARLLESHRSVWVELDRLRNRVLDLERGRRHGEAT